MQSCSVHELRPMRSIGSRPCRSARPGAGPTAAPERIPPRTLRLTICNAPAPSPSLTQPESFPCTTCQEMKLQDLKAKTPAELLSFAEELGVENAEHHAQAGADVRHPQAAGRQTTSTIFGDGVLEILPDGFGFLRSPDANYLPGPDDIYVSPAPDPPLRPAHRRHGRGPDPRAQGGRALLRAAQGQHDQFRGPGEGAPQGQLRQPDAALSRPSG